MSKKHKKSQAKESKHTAVIKTEKKPVEQASAHAADAEQDNVEKLQAHSQKIAALVYSKVKPLIQEWEKDNKKKNRYGKLCYDFPFMVRENGLIAAFGFLLAKSKESEESPEGTLLNHYSSLLNLGNPTAMHQHMLDAPLMEYRHLTQRTLQLAEWFKRYAEGVLKVDATGESVEEKQDGNG